MTVSFRNVDVDPQRDPDEWPFEAVLAAIERGTVSDWRRLASTIRANPWGPCAQAVEQITSWEENYGADALFSGVVSHARTAADAASRRTYGARIRAIRSGLGMSQRELAPLIGTSAQRLSSYESGRVAPSVQLLGRLDRVVRRLRPDAGDGPGAGTADPCDG